MHLKKVTIVTCTPLKAQTLTYRWWRWRERHVLGQAVLPGAAQTIELLLVVARGSYAAILLVLRKEWFWSWNLLNWKFFFCSELMKVLFFSEAHFYLRARFCSVSFFSILNLHCLHWFLAPPGEAGEVWEPHIGGQHCQPLREKECITYNYQSAKINKHLIIWVIWTGRAEVQGESFPFTNRIKCS